VVDQSSILPTSYDVSEIIDMIDKKDTYQMIRNKLDILSKEIYKVIILHKRKFPNKLTDSNGLPNAMGLLLKHMRDDFDQVNDMMLTIKPGSKTNPKFRVGDFKFWNDLWGKYNKLKETYETN
tara:strand:+ start:351 stop:719 length:369 start_codon:yes stop_codon:yes gene_type:complete